LVVQVSVAETKPLFFKLEPNPARLEIETSPPGATLYVNGNRTQNPYLQDVAPGRFELFAEAPDYQSRREELTLAPGDKRLLIGPNVFKLLYVQRSGRPELVVSSAIVGALVGAGAVAAGLGTDLEAANVSSVTFALGGAVTGAVAGVLVANNIVPSRIPDNRGLFVIGGMWIGAAEGALTGFVARQAMATKDVNMDLQHPEFASVGPYKHAPLGSQLRWGFVGSLPGLLVGTGGAALLVDKAPTYGMVALIQSAAAGGAVAGSLAAVALRWNPLELKEVTQKSNPDTKQLDPPYLQDARSTLTLSLPALIGLNVGLGAGLLAAYLPNQSRYGPSWKRVALIDLTAGAGALAGGIFACVADPDCVKGNEATPLARAHAAEVALVTGGLGAIAGILLSGNVDKGYDSGATSPTPPPTLGLLPAPDGRGGVTPLLTAAGLF
ncbi:MAG TPA: hypothetical protein VHU40_00565, partial [Polyangia bacterium]|nr:hypothetical protein [Polyangia bacterium]